MFCEATRQMCSDLEMDYDQVRKDRQESANRYSYNAYGFGCKYPLTFSVLLEQTRRMDQPMLSVWIQIPYSEGSAPFEFEDYDIPKSKIHGGYLVRWVEYAVYKFHLEHEPAKLSSLFSGANIRVYGMEEDPDLTQAEMKIFINGIKNTQNDPITVYRFRHMNRDPWYRSYSYGFNVAPRSMPCQFWVFFHGVGYTYPVGTNRYLNEIEKMTKNIKGSRQKWFDIEYGTLHKYLLEHAVSFEPHHDDEMLFDSNEAVLKKFHPEVEKHARGPLNQDRYFDSVDECCKAFGQYVSRQFKSKKYGQPLMVHAFSLGKGIHLVQEAETKTEENIREGLRFLCMGLMRHVRNPLEHETQLDLPMDRQDALDVLGLISYLFRQTENLLANEKYTLVSKDSSPSSESDKSLPNSSGSS